MTTALTATEQNRADHRAARAAFTRALQDYVDANTYIPCLGNGWLWTSGVADDRACAARLCGDCPLKDLCLAEAIAGDEKSGVWGGVDLEDPDADMDNLNVEELEAA